MPKVNTFRQPLIKEFWKKTLAALNARMGVVEEDVQIILDGGTPIQGSFSCGDWTPDYEEVIAFGGWTAATT